MNRPLSGLLMVPLIRVLEAPKPKVSVNEDSELDDDSNDRRVRRASKVVVDFVYN